MALDTKRLPLRRTQGTGPRPLDPREKSNLNILFRRHERLSFLLVKIFAQVEEENFFIFKSFVFQLLSMSRLQRLRPADQNKAPPAVPLPPLPGGARDAALLSGAGRQLRAA